MSDSYEYDPNYITCVEASQEGRTIEWWNCAMQQWEKVDFSFLFPNHPGSRYKTSEIQFGVRVKQFSTMLISWEHAYERILPSGDIITGIGRNRDGIYYEVPNGAGGSMRRQLMRGQTTIEVRV